MALIDIGTIRGTCKVEILLKLVVYNMDQSIVLKAISELVEKYDHEYKGGEK